MANRKALVVGIDHYRQLSPLYGCCNDARQVAAVLARHGNGDPNFVAPRLMLADRDGAEIDRSTLKDAVRELFAFEGEVALFYFAGHGHVEATGGYLCSSDCRDGDDGLSLSEVLILANQCPARHKLILLDSCHSGIAGTRADGGKLAELGEGMTILTASTAQQYANERNGSGIFTALLVDALNGAAANLTGDVTPGSVYAHIDQSLGPWDQRPVFKTNVKSFVSLRKTTPAVSLDDLRSLLNFFPKPGSEWALDPGYEPTSGAADPGKTAQFAVLQRLNRVNLLVPVGVAHMYYAAMQSRSCRLTALGEHYRRLVERGLI
jgi:Caspase domain